MAVRLSSLFLVIAMLAFSACATPPQPEPEAAASDAHVRVVVAPLNLAVRAPTQIEGKGDRVWEELLHYFQARDRDVATLSPISAERLWLEGMLDLDFSNRSLALQIARSRFAVALAAHYDYDVLVIPSLVLRAGHLRGHHASWDGVQRVVPKSAGVTLGGLQEVINLFLG